MNKPMPTRAEGITMSFKHMSLVVDHSKTRGPDRAIMLVISRRMNEAGQCWPGINRIADDAGLDRRCVIRRLKHISASGELLIQRQNHDVQTRGGMQAVNVYTLAINSSKGSGPQPLPSGSKGVADVLKGGGCSGSKGVADVLKGGGPQPPESSLNENKKSSLNQRGGHGVVFKIPDSLQTPEFIAAWESWQTHRKEIHKPLTAQSVKMQMKDFTAWGTERAIAAIEYTIKKGWQGIREPNQGDANGERKSKADREYLEVIDVPRL